MGSETDFAGSLGKEMDVVQYLLWCLCESVMTCWHACCVVFGHLSLIFQHAAQFWRLDCEKIADKDNAWLTRRLSSVLHLKVRLKIFNQLSTWNLATANWHVHPTTHKTYSVTQHCTEQPSSLLFSPHFLHLPSIQVPHGDTSRKEALPASPIRLHEWQVNLLRRGGAPSPRSGQK